jgi:small-conductance mechanosensitive channel
MNKKLEEMIPAPAEAERSIKNVVGSLKKTLKEQNEQTAKLSQQLEKAYQQVQEIAVKTIEGSSTIKSFANLQQWISEQTKKQSSEK